jgi:tetratricopeptide (TPR) repeat protein
MDLNYVDRHDEAIEVARNILRTVPNHPLARGALWMAYFAKGMSEELLAEIKATYESFGDQEAREALELGETEGGYRGAMIRLAETLVARSLSRPVSFCDIAQIYAYAGENDRVLEWLERAFEERDPNLPYIGVHPDFDNVHNEPRFQDLLRRINFPEDVIARILDDTK